MKRLLIIGPPGSGKGTQGERIIAKYGIPSISTGDIFRKNISEGTELGKKAKEYMDKGELVPDSLVLDLVVSRLSEDDTKEGYLLDGFPRTQAQAEALDAILNEKGEVIDHVIYISIPDDELIKRITSRRVCTKCGKTYNTMHFPTKQEGICDICGEEVVQRSDDTLETARNRIDVYNRQTMPLVGYYRGKGLLAEFDGMGSADEIFERITGLVGE